MTQQDGRSGRIAPSMPTALISLFMVLVTLMTLTPTQVDAQVRVRMLDGKVVEGRFYDLGNEYLELSRRLGTKMVLKREVLGWSSEDLEEKDKGGILLVLESGNEVAGDVSFDSGTREWVVKIKLGSARYKDSEVLRTIQPDGTTSDGRFTIRKGFNERLTKAIQGIREGDLLAKKDGINFIRSAGYFASAALDEELKKEFHPELRKLQLDQSFRMALPAGVSESHPGFLEALTTGDPRDQVSLLREVLLENGADLYPLLGLLLLDDGQSAEVRSFSIDILQRTHSISELVKAWQVSEGKAQLALAIALGENGIYIGFSTLLEALELEEVAARKLAANKLAEYTGETFGFEAEGSAEQRSEAIVRWKEWWETHRSKIESVTVAAMEGRTDTIERKRSSDLWKKGLIALEDNRIDTAERFFEEATLADPSAMGPYVSLGILLYQQRSNFDLALESFSKALGRKPGSGDLVNERACYYHIGKIYSLAFDLEKARGAFRKAVQLDPNFSVAWYDLGQIQYDEALLSSGERADRKSLLEESRETFARGLSTLKRYREGLVVVDRTNLPFDSQLPFSARDHNKSLREIRQRILADLGRFRARIAAISWMIGDDQRVIEEFEAARMEESINEDLKFLSRKARARLNGGAAPEQETPAESEVEGSVSEGR
jgi:tetratricopeptide (TPR) repeat protein